MPSWAGELMNALGLVWPKGNASQLWTAGEAWIAFAVAVRDARESAQTGAAQVWQVNQGVPISNFQQWWSWRRGPSANLAGTAIAADGIGASLKGMSVQVALLKAAFLANLVSLGATFAAIGIAIFASGGLGAALAAAGGGLVISYFRRRMILAMNLALAAIAAQLVGVLLRQAAEKLQPAPPETMPRRGQQRQPEEEPRPPLPFPFPPPDSYPRTDRRQRCSVQPGWTQPTFNGIPITSEDRRVAGGGLQSISRRVLSDGSREVVIDGVVRDPIPRSNLENGLRPLAESIGIPSGQYHLAHTWGAGLGSEAAAGIYLAPSQANLVYHAGVETWLRDVHQSVGPEGWVELRTVTTTHPSSVWNGTGANLMASTTYEATACYPGGRIQTYPPVTVNIDPPSNRDGTFRPGRVWTEVN